MSLEHTFATYFKPEIQKRGREDFAKGVVFISNASDTQIQALVKSLPPLKVSFESNDIASPAFTASCSCSSSQKGSLCKHMWSTILATQAKHPDFLESKTQIEVADPIVKKESPQTAAYKEKQAEFKKLQYEKQKLWNQKKRLEKKIKKMTPPPVREKYSKSVEQALNFFTKNGFAMIDLPTADQLNLARKQLSRVFHPDKGGSHDEAVLLNQHFETLNRLLTMITGN